MEFLLWPKDIILVKGKAFLRCILILIHLCFCNLNANIECSSRKYLTTLYDGQDGIFPYNPTKYVMGVSKYLLVIWSFGCVYTLIWISNILHCKYWSIHSHFFTGFVILLCKKYQNVRFQECISIWFFWYKYIVIEIIRFCEKIDQFWVSLPFSFQSSWK